MDNCSERNIYISEDFSVYFRSIILFRWKKICKEKAIME